MKKLKYHFIIVVTACISFSCSDLLVEQPKSDAAPELIFNSKNGISAALRNCYTIFTETGYKTANGVAGYGITPAAGRACFLLTEVPADDCWIKNTNNNPRVTLDTYEFDNDNENIASLYFSYFIGIKDCNVLLKYLKTSTVDDKAFIEQTTAEARAIRAFCYFSYVRLFGDGPILTEDIEFTELDNLKRKPAKDIYKLIVADLNFAASKLPLRNTKEGAGRFSSAAAKALLSEVYLTMAGRVYNDVKSNFDNMTQKDMYKKSADYADSVLVNTSVYSLYAHYKELFTVKGNNSKESILEAVSANNLYPAEALPDVVNGYDYGKDPDTGIQPFKGMFFRVDAATSSNVYLLKTLGRYTISPNLINAFETFPSDKRMQTYIYSFNNGFGNSSLKTYSTIKYADSTVFARGLVDAAESRAHFKIIRLAHVMLMYAEAMNEYNNGPDTKAIAYMEAIRQRAGITTSAIPTEYDNFRNEVWEERRKELYFEGYRWFDLVRTNRLKSQVENAKAGVNYSSTPLVQEKHYLFPIPAVAFRINPTLGVNNPNW